MHHVRLLLVELGSPCNLYPRLPILMQARPSGCQEQVAACCAWPVCIFPGYSGVADTLNEIVNEVWEVRSSGEFCFRVK